MGNMKFKDKVVIVTGASSGIGREAARLFKERGASVVCLSRRKCDEFYSISADVTDEAAVAAAVKEVTERFGRIDILVNNAGMGISGAVEDTTSADAHRIFEVNFFGALNMIKAVLPAMRRAGGGAIINVSSVAAELPIPFQSFYSATKAALSSLSGALKNEVEPFGIKVSCVLPGDVKTDFTSSRKKNAVNSPAYGGRVERAVQAMEHDEQNGMPPALIAKLIVRTAAKKRPPVAVTGGAKYALFLFLKRILPKRLVSFVLGKLYD